VTAVAESLLLERASDGLVVDIGGTKTMVGLVADGHLVELDTFPTDPSLAPDRLTAAIADTGRRLADRHQIVLSAAAVAVPGVLERASGIVRWAANLPFSDYPLAAALGAQLGHVPVVIEHDANFGVVGEAAYGAAQGLADVAYLTVSTGIGMGTLVGGKIVEGSAGLAGEIGHAPVVAQGRLCSCGATGCLEAYASGRALAALGQEAAAAGRSPLLSSVAARAKEITARDVAAAAERGDPACVLIVDVAVRELSRAAAMVVAVVDPAIVVLGGGVMTSPYVAGRLLATLTAAVDAKVALALLGTRSVMLGGMRFLTPKPAAPAAPLEEKVS
jgi:glucokinase